jgi:ketosteroid isomerase-like protein
MCDAAAIRRTIVRYGQCIDNRDLDGWVSLYATDGIHEINGGVHTGHDELRPFMAAAFGRIDGLRHLTLGSDIVIDSEDRAHATSDWMTVRRDEDGSARIASVGRFDDQFRKEDGEWRFAHRQGTRWAGAPPAGQPSAQAATTEGDA